MKVNLVQTMDSANLLKNKNCISTGIRLIDIKTKDPITGEYLFKEKGLGFIQTRDWCIPVQTVFGNETKRNHALILQSISKQQKRQKKNDIDSILTEAG